MKTQLLSANQYRTMPWKNGHGKTTEIAIHPANAQLSLQNFDWRLSSAPLVEDGDFSLFPNHQRFLALLEGAEINLYFDESFKNLKRNQVLSFSGDQKVRLQLPSGPARDLNLIVKKNLYSQLQIYFDPVEELKLDEGSYLIFAFAEKLELTIDTQSPITINSSDTFFLAVDKLAEVCISIRNLGPFAFAQIQTRADLK